MTCEEECIESLMLLDPPTALWVCVIPSLHWHRGKLPFEIPNFATKIAKFCHKKLPNLPHFAIKIAKFCKLSLLIASLFFVPEGQEFYIHLKVHTKSHSGAYQKEQ